MNNIRNLAAVLCCASMAALAACGGGDDDPGDNPPPPEPVTLNLQATGLQVLTPAPRIAYPLTVSVTITANEARDNVPVSLVTVARNDDADAEVRRFPLGDVTIARVEAGTRSYELEVSIPSNVELPGSYFVAAEIDPAEVLAETSKADNTAAVETLLHAAEQPNVLIEALQLDRSVLDISTASYAEQVTGLAGNVHNADAGGSVTIGADGLAVGEVIDLEGYAMLRMLRSDHGTRHDVPLYLWNSAAGRYMNAYGVDPQGVMSTAPEWLPLGEFAPQLAATVGSEVELDDIDRGTVQMSFYVPGRLGKELENAMRYTVPPPGGGPLLPDLPTVPPPDLTQPAIDALRAFLVNLPTNGIRGDESQAMAVMDFQVCVQIRPADPAILDRVADDNERCEPLTVALPPITPTPVAPPPAPGFVPHFNRLVGPGSSSSRFATGVGGKVFAFELAFGTSASADNRGYIETLSGNVPVTLFGSRVDVFGLAARVQLAPDYAGKPAAEQSGYRIELRHDGSILAAVDLPPTSSPAVSLNFSKEAGKDFEAFVGPVPVTGSATVGGSMGVEYQYQFQSDPVQGYTLGNSLEPFIGLDITVSAGVGNRAFSAGVEGVLSLLDERLVLFSGTQIDVLDAGYQSQVAQFVISRGHKVTNQFTGPRGAINLYAKYQFPKFRTCSWGFVKGKCLSLVSMKATKNLYRSKALFQMNDVLHEDNDVQLAVVVRPGQSPAYYAP